MTRSALALVAVVLLIGCTGNTEVAKEALQRELRIGQSADYRDFKAYPGGVVCGEFNPIGRFEVREGWRRFVFRDDKADVSPSDDDWDFFCSKDPKAQFQARFGTGPIDQKNATVLAVQRDLNALDQALRQYQLDNANYPLTKQGLDALITATTIRPEPVNFKLGGYIDKIPQDPWGRPYHYSSEQKLRMEPSDYSLYTLGKDGVEGGTGEDADISNLQLEYLNHIANL